jgi:hypothetical protein
MYQQSFGVLQTTILLLGKIREISFPSRNTQHNEHLSSLQIELEYAVHR